MSEIVCQVGNQANQVELIWSSHGGFFRPYIISGPQLSELRRAADRSVTGPSTSGKPSCREALETLVCTLNRAGASRPPWEPSYELAEAGFRLFNCLLPSEDETARKVRRWLEDLRKQSGLIGLEVVVEERSADAGTFLSVPWNLVYDERPAKYKAEFQAGQGVERWRPFWSARYKLTSGRRVEPLKRLPLWVDPRVVVVVDPTVHEGLVEEQKQRLDQFLAEAGLTAVGSMDELEAALEEGYPRLLYWLGHATPEYLMLGDERIAPADLRNLLRSFDDRERPEGMLAFLNACQTAEAGSGGSFLDVLHSFGFTGAIATERQTIDTFANEFGLAFLQKFLREGKPLGELLHGLRLDRSPLGLLYGAHCPPEIRVRSGIGVVGVQAPLPIRESGPVAGVTLGEAATRGRRKRRGHRRSPQRPAVQPPVVGDPLPGEPYRSLSYYEWKDRALFTGRDADVVRFAATLDRPDTRILVLHGESGTGKSSFLRAGVIPYLEEECVGYRFLRQPDRSVRIIQPAKDLVGQAAQTLLDATETTLTYRTPEDEPEEVNLRPLIDEAVGAPADFTTLREALRRDLHLFAEILARIAGRLPYALVLVFDQIEEVFTLANTPEEIAGRDHALRMIQRVVDLRADVKLILSLRTEYYGRLLDHLRAGRRDLTGVRDDLLRDFSRSALIEAITRPTSETPLADGQPSPREKYGFRYAKGIPEAIADGVLALRSENQDSVLPLAQVICTQLYERERMQPGPDRVITREDLDAIKGVEGGLQAFAEDALVRSLCLGPEDREAFKSLFSQLYSRQPDGTLTTWLMPRESLESQWERPTPFADLLESARSVRLLREDELRIEGAEPRRYIRLGHDALAKVAAAWKAEREENQRLEGERLKRLRQRWRLAGVAVFFLTMTGLFGWLWLRADLEARHARIAEKEARDKEGDARAILSFLTDNILDAARLKREAKGLGYDVTLRKALEAALPQVQTLFNGRPELEATVRFTLGSSFLYSGDATTAEKQFQIARALYTARLGPDHPETLRSMNGLADSYYALGRHAEALKLGKEALTLANTRLGPDDPDTLRSMQNVARSYAALGRHAEALRLREEVLWRSKAKLGPDHPDTLSGMNYLANTYAAQGRHAEALKLGKEALELRRSTLGPDHPDTLYGMHTLAISHEALDHQAEALELREETLALRRKKLGPDHPDTLLSMMGLAASFADLGRQVEALNLREQTLALQRSKLGPDHPDTLRSMNNLADSYYALGRHAEALKLREEALALRRSTLGPDHPDTLSSMTRIAQSLVALDRPSESVAVIDDCLRRAEGKVLNPRLVRRALDLRLRAFAKQKDASGCRQTAELWEKLNRTDADSLYKAACFRAVAAGVLRADDRAPDAGQQACTEADTATSWLAKAVAAGFQTPRHLALMTEDSDLDALRDRADFRRFLAELFDRGFPKDPFVR
jgi:tetratricopeptide (TPR) repeat protein